MPKVELHLSPMGEPSKVLVDGQDIAAGVRGLTLHAAAGHLAMMSLDLNLIHVTAVQGEAEVHIPEAARDALVALGWTPPKEA